MSSLTRLHDPKEEAARLENKRAEKAFINEKRTFVVAQITAKSDKINFKPSATLKELEEIAAENKVKIEYPEGLQVFSGNDVTPVAGGMTPEELEAIKTEAFEAGKAEQLEVQEKEIETMLEAQEATKTGIVAIAMALGIKNMKKMTPEELLAEMETAAKGAVAAAAAGAKKTN